MRKRLLLLLFALFSAIPIAAQQAPDYSIRNIRTPASEEEIVIQFEVVNNGASAAAATTANVTIATTGQTVGSAAVAPLGENEQTTLTVRIPARSPGLTPGDSVLFLIRVGIGDIEAENSNTVGDNSAITPAITIPAVESIPPTAEPTQVATPEPVPTVSAPSTSFTLPFDIDLSNPLHIALIIGAGGILLILIWMLTVILRLLFSRPPTFTTWQPPYVFTPLMNPNTTAGRRQLWQQHAQSDALAVPCAPGSFTARKALIGMNGGKLAGWRVVAVRISQYDMYGRVARSQTVAPKSVVNRLDRAVRKSGKMSPQRAERTMRPAAGRLLNDFRRRLTRTSSLPIALDIRLKGMHGEVRIVFELHQCIDNHWQMVDQWEPEMTVLSGSLFENFTYSLNGQRPGEKKRQFHQRLHKELTQVLAAMIQQPPPMAVPPETESDTAKLRPVSGDTVANT
jgi:hypothetical protein